MADSISSALSDATSQLSTAIFSRGNVSDAIKDEEATISFYQDQLVDINPNSTAANNFRESLQSSSTRLAELNATLAGWDLQIDQAKAEIESIKAQEADALLNASYEAQAADPTSTIKTPEATNLGFNQPDNLISYSTPTNIQDIVQPLTGSYGFGVSSNNFLNQFSSSGGSSVPPGAERVVEQPAKVQFRGVKPDFRPRLLIPTLYLDSNQTAGPAPGIIKNSGGIVFPYTPAISQDYKANYASVTPQHSNYALYFYKNSSPSEISLSAKFTVQEDNDAHYFLSVIHILRSLIKMRFGTNDFNTGSPPPVCRLYAYGAYVFDNVPVALQSFSLKLDDNVDYFSLSSTSNGESIKQIFSGANMVPVISTISMSFIPMYSRREMMNGGVKNWLNGTSRSEGLL